MKKILVLTIAMFSLLACSSDDDNLDPLVGSWYLFSENNEEVPDCEKKSTLQILENGTFKSLSYYFDEDTQECTEEGNSNGTWTNKGSNIYGIKPDGRDKEGILNITFKDNNNTFSYSETDEDENGEVIATYTTTFKRK